MNIEVVRNKVNVKGTALFLSVLMFLIFMLATNIVPDPELIGNGYTYPYGCILASLLMGCFSYFCLVGKLKDSYKKDGNSGFRRQVAKEAIYTFALFVFVCSFLV